MISYVIILLSIVFVYFVGKAVINYYYNEGVKKGLHIAEDKGVGG